MIKRISTRPASEGFFQHLHEIILAMKFYIGIGIDLVGFNCCGDCLWWNRYTHSIFYFCGTASGVIFARLSGKIRVAMMLMRGVLWVIDNFQQSIQSLFFEQWGFHPNKEAKSMKTQRLKK